MSRFIITAAAMVVVGGVAGVLYSKYSGPAAPEQSPLANSERLAPAEANLFEGKIKPVPELVSRAEAEAHGRQFGHSALGLELLEEYLTPLRDNQQKGPSGVWTLTPYYFSYRDTIAGNYRSLEALKFMDDALAKWEAKGGKAPGPYILKGYALRDRVLDVERLGGLETAEGREALQGRMGQLTEYLAKVKPIAAKDPAWYMLQINAMGFSCNMPEVWKAIEEGSQAFPTFYQSYYETLLAGLRCGEDGEHLIDRLVKLGVERTKATEGQSFYARMFWVASGYWTKNVLTSDIIDWTRMKAGMLDVLQRYPDPWNVNNFALLACQGRQAAIARELLPKALEAPVVKVWKTSERFKACRDWAMTTAAK